MRAKKQSRSKPEILAEVPWVQELPAAVRVRIVDEVYETFHLRGEHVSRVGDPSHSWIFVEEGLLKLSAVDRSGRVIMYTSVSAHGWVGEGAVIKRETRRYDIVALRDSRLLHLPSPTFRWLLDSNIEFNRFIITLLNERLSQYISMVEIDRLQDPVTRVARAIAILYNPVLYPSMTTTVPLSQQELGELTGLSRQIVNSALKTLQTHGAITTDYGNILVKDVNALRTYDDARQ